MLATADLLAEGAAVADLMNGSQKLATQELIAHQVIAKMPLKPARNVISIHIESTNVEGTKYGINISAGLAE